MNGFPARIFLGKCSNGPALPSCAGISLVYPLQFGLFLICCRGQRRIICGTRKNFLSILQNEKRLFQEFINGFSNDRELRGCGLTMQSIHSHHFFPDHSKNTSGHRTQDLYLTSQPMAFKSGFITILGKPNAGKSTLLNAMLGSRLVITSPKAQTTRHRIFGILNGPEYQIVFSDTPGVIKPRYGLQEAMMFSVSQSIEDADLAIVLIDGTEPELETDVLDLVKDKNVPVLLVINKCDLATTKTVADKKTQILEVISVKDTIEISALKGTNISLLLEKIVSLLPEGPKWFDDNMMSDRPERFFVAEIIREKIFMNLEQEIPYGCEVTIHDFKEGEDLDKIQAEIHVEKQSHKGMLIGKRGEMIKTIGTESRVDIEKFLGKKIFLQLYVRVSENWKNDPGKLRRFGYKT